MSGFDPCAKRADGRGALLPRQRRHVTKSPEAVRRSAALAAVSLLALAAALATGAAEARAAEQSIRVAVPIVRVCTNTIGGITVGVRWLSGPRRYRIRVYDPNGKIVLLRHGLATRAWKRWSVRPTLGGTYRTIYNLPGRTARYRTQSLGCGG